MFPESAPLDQWVMIKASVFYMDNIAQVILYFDFVRSVT